MKRPITPALINAFNPDNGNGPRFIEWSVTFEVLQNEVYDTLTPSASQNVEISRIAQTVDRNQDVLDVLTYEMNGFPLDGSKVIPPQVTELPTAQVGLFMNTLSDENGYFATPQVYTATTAYAYDLIAITLDWGHVPAVDFTVEWYNGTTSLYSQSVTGNSSRYSMLNHAVPGVNRVTVSITRGQPIHFVRLAEFIPGAIVEYGPGNSDSLTIEENTDPLSERATAGTMKLVADNLAEQFDIFDPAGIYTYFKERMPLFPRISGHAPDGAREVVNMGKYYLQAPQLKGNLSKLQLDATNVLGTLQDTLYTRGTYKTATLATFVNDVAADAGVSVSFPASFSTTTRTAYIPSVPHAQALADIARATNTNLFVRSDDVIVFLELGIEPLLTVSADDYRTGDGLSPTDDTIINTVDLEFQRYSLEASKELAKMDATGALSSSTFYVDNAIIVTSSGTYYPKYAPAANLSAALSGGVLTITGQAIISTPGMVSVTSKRENEKAYVYEGKTSPFIQAANAQSVAAYILRRKATNRRIVKVNYRGYPYLDTGDVVAFNAGGEDTQPFFITRNRFTLGGGMTGVLEAREL